MPEKGSLSNSDLVFSKRFGLSKWPQGPLFSCCYRKSCLAELPWLPEMNAHLACSFLTKFSYKSKVSRCRLGDVLEILAVKMFWKVNLLGEKRMTLQNHWDLNITGSLCNSISSQWIKWCYFLGQIRAHSFTPPVHSHRNCPSHNGKDLKCELMCLSSLSSIIVISDKHFQGDFYTQKFKSTPVREQEGTEHQESTSVDECWDGPAKMPMLGAHRCANRGALATAALRCLCCVHFVLYWFVGRGFVSS